MQFQVPQFIETEDKIVGPFSLRQFAYVGAGGVLSALLYFAAVGWLWVIGSIIIFSIAISLAFVKIEGRPFANVVVSAFNFYWKPQTYVWQPEHPTATISHKQVTDEAGKSALEDILAKSVTKTKAVFTPPAPSQKPAAAIATQPVTRETAQAGSALHKSWERVQTDAALVDKNSDKQFLERKMAERYQIFQRIAGDRHAARRVDYR
jgi:PrgI family protein